ncbi:LUD domain-containing protein [uncultured Lutibacter sp.]|uniref:LutC/YkgG family protein n=1 Tax=uncultured Lutibacter sp. TaxID=437739 RepID=UPI00260A232D|nr:LUD domain-containing protein [uncultured Lutibacter sp.]
MGREAILNSIKKNKPELVNIPKIDIQLFDEEIDLVETFKNNVQLVGGSIAEINQINNLDSEIKKLYPNAKNIVTHIPESNLGTIEITNETTPHSLKNVDLTIIKGEFGISENGAVWISEDQFPIRVLPFITNDLVILLQKESLCLHMYNAYKKIFDRRRTFGLFISGPSKTADIEQCLVIGAQGAMNLTVILV